LHYVVVAGIDQEPELVWSTIRAVRKLLRQGRPISSDNGKALAIGLFLAIPTEGAPSAP